MSKDNPKYSWCGFVVCLFAFSHALGYLSEHPSVFRDSCSGHISNPAASQEVSMAKGAHWSLGNFLSHPFQNPHVSTEGLLAVLALLSKAIGVRNEPYSE